MAQRVVFWSKTAIKSLRATNLFICDIWNDKVSMKFLDSIDNTIELLIQNPYSGIVVDKSKFRKAFVNKHISLFYQINGNTIIILLIWDNRQNPGDLKRMISDSALDL